MIASSAPKRPSMNGIVATLDPTDGAAQYRLFRLYSLLGKRDLATHSLEEFKRLVHLYGSVSP